MSTSLVSLESTLVHLGDVTSCNLDFSYRSEVPFSYGEETITESNLLELRRRHSDVIRIRTFSKHLESRNGSDWEWYIVGRRRTLRMRVQAKRVQRNNVLKITHKVAGTGRQQRDLLIEAAQAGRMRPMYCIYCTESQRYCWRQPGRPQTGCLLADANNVPLHTRKLQDIEKKCWPWHYLFGTLPIVAGTDPNVDPRPRTEAAGYLSPPPRPLDWDAPTILDLNEDSDREYDSTGVEATTPRDLAMVNAEGTEELQRTADYDEERQFDRGIQRVVAVDVRSLNPRT